MDTIINFLLMGGYTGRGRQVDFTYFNGQIGRRVEIDLAGVLEEDQPEAKKQRTCPETGTEMWWPFKVVELRKQTFMMRGTESSYRVPTYMLVPLPVRGYITPVDQLVVAFLDNKRMLDIKDYQCLSWYPAFTPPEGIEVFVRPKDNVVEITEQPQEPPRPAAPDYMERSHYDGKKKKKEFTTISVSDSSDSDDDDVVQAAECLDWSRKRPLETREFCSPFCYLTPTKQPVYYEGYGFVAYPCD